MASSLDAQRFPCTAITRPHVPTPKLSGRAITCTHRWSSGDESGANTFLTMPYFPFLSSCAGYGNHMSFSKLVESHPDCTLVRQGEREVPCRADLWTPRIEIKRHHMCSCRGFPPRVLSRSCPINGIPGSLGRRGVLLSFETSHAKLVQQASSTPLRLARNNQIPYEQTKAINQWRSIGKSPFSDECLVQLTSDERYDDSGNLLIAEETRGVYLDCTFEEDIAMASAQRRYFDCVSALTKLSDYR